MLLKGGTETVGPDTETRYRERPGTQGALVCALCRNLVTSRASAVSMNGSHAHTFANPHGFEFRIGCFADAPGCTDAGEESACWTWFPGFTWRVSLCRQCGEHLGWLFGSPDARFFGLILDRLVQAD
ncbi:MAG TPA: cereblon family protein [Vicinamibacteria bacterium]|nr:cereblon family protein [Vicinamibacteria bacterium]